MALRGVLIAVLALGCEAGPSRRFVIPDEMRRPTTVPRLQPEADANPGQLEATTTPAVESTTFPSSAGGGAKKATTPLAQAAADSARSAVESARAPTAPEHRYVLRLADHGRIWEIELPETTGAYEVRVPLLAKSDTPTAADQELLAGTKAVTPGEAEKSYLGTLAKIGDLYAAKKYEMALIEAVDLQARYPKDARVAAMKGSLYQKLGKPKLAREAWTKALELDPADTAVAAALRSLPEE